MIIIETIQEMQEFIKKCKKQGKSIALVPTMGSLHKGHLTLIERAKEVCDVVVTSIFVNPTQFGPNEDFAKYPRDLTGDSEKAGSVGAEVIFHPKAREMYPEGYSTFVQVEGITDKLCGMSRPGHFRGVTTVVTKLFNIIQPDKAFFGQKDAQQVLVLQRMAADLNMNVTLEVVPIVREADGLAMSSRNAFLSAKERSAALILSQSLQLAEFLVRQGEKNIENIRMQVIEKIATEKLAACEYVEIYHYPTLQVTDEIKEKALLALAVKIGNTRLIDNTILEVK